MRKHQKNAKIQNECKTEAEVNHKGQASRRTKDPEPNNGNIG